VRAPLPPCSSRRCAAALLQLYAGGGAALSWSGRLQPQCMSGVRLRVDCELWLWLPSCSVAVPPRDMSRACCVFFGLVAEGVLGIQQVVS